MTEPVAPPLYRYTYIHGCIHEYIRADPSESATVGSYKPVARMGKLFTPSGVAVVAAGPHVVLWSGPDSCKTANEV